MVLPPDSRQLLPPGLNQPRGWPSDVETRNRCLDVDGFLHPLSLSIYSYATIGAPHTHFPIGRVSPARRCRSLNVPILVASISLLVVAVPSGTHAVRPGTCGATPRGDGNRQGPRPDSARAMPCQEGGAPAPLHGRGHQLDHGQQAREDCPPDRMSSAAIVSPFQGLDHGVGNPGRRSFLALPWAILSRPVGPGKSSAGRGRLRCRALNFNFELQPAKRLDRRDRQAFSAAAVRALELFERFCARRREVSTFAGWECLRQTLPQVFPPGFVCGKTCCGRFLAGELRGEIGFPRFRMGKARGRVCRRRIQANTSAANAVWA